MADTMQVKDQIKAAMDRLEIGVPEVARRVGLSNQSVRYWLAGRSYPGKRHAAALERALGIKLDYTADGDLTTEPWSKHDEVALLLAISRLRPLSREALKHLVDTCLVANPAPPSSISRVQDSERADVELALTVSRLDFATQRTLYGLVQTMLLRQEA